VRLGEVLGWIVAGASPSRRRATSCAKRPAALTTARQATAKGSRPAGLDRHPALVDTAPDHGSGEEHAAAGAFEVGLEGAHEGVAVDDAGRRGQQAGDALDVRLERAHLGAAEWDEVIDTVGARLGAVLVEAAAVRHRCRRR
jgi:hypothetical protein